MRQYYVNLGEVKRCVVVDFGSVEVVWARGRPVMFRDWVTNETHITSAASAGDGVFDDIIDVFLKSDQTTKVTKHTTRKDFELRLLRYFL